MADSESNSDQQQRRQIVFSGSEPMKLPDLPDNDDVTEIETTSEHQAFVRAVGDTIAAYLKASKELLRAKYAHVKNLVPSFLSNSGNVLLICTPQGALIRYEAKPEGVTEPGKLVMTWTPQDIGEVAASVSQRLIYCRPDPTSPLPEGDPGMTLKLMHGSAAGENPIFDIGIRFDAVLQNPGASQPAPAKPFCLFSVRNSLEFQMEIESQPTDQQSPPRRFLCRAPMRIPVGWDCIELYLGVEPHR